MPRKITTPSFDFMELDDAVVQARALNRLLLAVIGDHNTEDAELRHDFERGLDELVHVTDTRLQAAKESARPSL